MKANNNKWRNVWPGGFRNELFGPDLLIILCFQQFIPFSTSTNGTMKRLHARVSSMCLNLLLYQSLGFHSPATYFFLPWTLSQHQHILNVKSVRWYNNLFAFGNMKLSSIGKHFCIFFYSYPELCRCVYLFMCVCVSVSEWVSVRNYSNKTP